MTVADGDYGKARRGAASLGWASVTDGGKGSMEAILRAAYTVRSCAG